MQTSVVIYIITLVTHVRWVKRLALNRGCAPPVINCFDGNQVFKNPYIHIFVHQKY